MDLATSQWTHQRGWTHALPMWDGPSTLVLAFGDPTLSSDDDGLAALVQTYPNSVVVGCSTAGQILATDLSDGALTVSVTRFHNTELVLEASPVCKESSYSVGNDLGSRLHKRGDDLAAVFVLAEGITVNGSALATGLADGAGGAAVVTGGLAGDGDRFVKTWVLVNGLPLTSHVTAVGLYGKQLDVGVGSSGGWKILGPERVVTRSVGTVLYELDGQPALELYKHYLGDRASGLPGTALLFPLQIRTTAAGGRDVVRTILAVDEANQSMTFAGDVPEGSTAQLMRATTAQIVEAAQDAAQAARLSGQGPALAVAVSCVGRRLLLGRLCEDELDAVEAGLDADHHLIGFYSYGELSPLSAGGCDLHNQTMTLTTFRERTP